MNLTAPVLTNGEHDAAGLAQHAATECRADR
jgi:hypothetical protein